MSQIIVGNQVKSLNPLQIIEQGERLPFSFDRGGLSLAGWTCNITVKQKVGDTATVNRTIVANTGAASGFSNSSLAFNGFLTATETAALGAGLWYLTATLTKASTDEVIRYSERFSVTGSWVGGSGSPASPPTAPFTYPFISVIVATDETVFLPGFSLPYDYNVTVIQLSALIAPVGADLNVSLLKNGVAHSEVGVLTDGSQGPEDTTFGTALSMSADTDVLSLKYTQVGSTTPGNGITGNMTIVPV